MREKTTEVFLHIPTIEESTHIQIDDEIPKCSMINTSRTKCKYYLSEGWA